MNRQQAYFWNYLPRRDYISLLLSLPPKAHPQNTPQSEEKGNGWTFAFNKLAYDAAFIAKAFRVLILGSRQYNSNISSTDIKLAHDYVLKLKETMKEKLQTWE